MVRQTIAALERVQADYIVTAAASCAIAIMHDYERLLRDEPAWRGRAARLAGRTLDILSFLDRVARPPALPAARSAPVATYHSFCQSTNVLGLGATGARLLGLAGLPVVELPEGEVCCGFGGSTSLNHPEVARGIVERKLGNARETGAAVLATDNPGCVLHLRGAAGASRASFAVRHVVELLAERLDEVAASGSR
jgi:Fe-S oxidoreductase